jgi:hypothetical protein
MKMRGSLDRTKRIADSIFFFFPKVLIVRVMGRARNNFIGRARVYKLLVSGETSPYGLKVLIAQMKKGTFFSSLGRVLYDIPGLRCKHKNKRCARTRSKVRKYGSGNTSVLPEVRKYNVRSMEVFPEVHVALPCSSALALP